MSATIAAQPSVLPGQAVRPKQLVPVRKVGGVVDSVQTVVGLVVRRPPEEGQRPAQGPGQVVAAVVLHRQPAVEQVEDQLAERVAAQQAGAGPRQQQQRQKLRPAGVLGRQGKGHLLLVVLPVHVDVEPWKSGEETQRESAVLPSNLLKVIHYNAIE